jgi:pimeloyl-ACP methyl ester carboxylesterase
VHHLHGAADRTFPVRYTHPDVILPHAGHVLPLTHPAEVNAFIAGVLVHHPGDPPRAN